MALVASSSLRASSLMRRSGTLMFARRIASRREWSSRLPSASSMVTTINRPRRLQWQPMNIHPSTLVSSSFRCFQTVSDYHLAADQVLEDIQDAIDQTLEEAGIPDFEVNFSSGVLTMVFPPHGTWVINKQTPNQQLWWSSPISGPRRYEFQDGEWVFTRDESHSMTLTQALQDEIRQIYKIELDV